MWIFCRTRLTLGDSSWVKSGVAEVRKIHREYNGKSRLAIAKTGLHSVNPGLQPGLAIVKSRLNKAQSWAHPLTYIYQETFFRNLLGQGRTYLRSARKSLTTRQNLKKLAPSSSTNSTSTKQNLKKITQINNDVTEETCSDKAEPISDQQGSLLQQDRT